MNPRHRPRRVSRHGSPCAGGETQKPDEGVERWSKSEAGSLLPEPADGVCDRVVVDGEVLGKSLEGNATLMHPSRLLSDALVDGGDRDTAKLDLDRKFGQGSQPLRARPPRKSEAVTDDRPARSAATKSMRFPIRRAADGLHFGERSARMNWSRAMARSTGNSRQHGSPSFAAGKTDTLK